MIIDDEIDCAGVADSFVKLTLATIVLQMTLHQWIGEFDQAASFVVQAVERHTTDSEPTDDVSEPVVVHFDPPWFLFDGGEIGIDRAFL